MIKKLPVVFTVMLAGCSATMNVTVMPRDSGSSYSGELYGSGSGSGTMSVTRGDIKCSGPAARVASNQSFGFINTFASDNKGNSLNSMSNVSIDGDTVVKALLSCSDGKGLRCDITGRNANGGGICKDDAGHVFDVVVTRK